MTKVTEDGEKLEPIGPEDLEEFCLGAHIRDKHNENWIGRIIRIQVSGKDVTKVNKELIEQKTNDIYLTTRSISVGANGWKGEEMIHRSIVNT